MSDTETQMSDSPESCLVEAQQRPVNGDRHDRQVEVIKEKRDMAVQTIRAINIKLQGPGADDLH